MQQDGPAFPSNAAVKTAQEDAHKTAAAVPPRRLDGRIVVLVHPAWHSCGSHQVFVSQAEAYRALGATLYSLAVADFPGWMPGSQAHRAYVAATADLVADRRYFAGMPRHKIATPHFIAAAYRWLHGNAAAMLCETVANAELPSDLLGLPHIDLIHCNHFFCMPAALALKARHMCPVLLDTHDVQARQFSLRNEAAWRVPPKASFEDMLALEIAEMKEADLLIHLNDEEAQTMRQLLPQKRHALVYPTIKPVPGGAGGSDFIIVASANYPNYLSVVWFLTEVLPLVPDVPVRIIGNIDQEFANRAPALLEQYAGSFAGRIDDLDAAYANAAAILLPTTTGHGISIKTIEALSSGVPLIATREAFRGMAIDPAELANVDLVSDAAGFAAALRHSKVKSAAKPKSMPEATPLAPPGARLGSDTRRLYEKLFAFEAYLDAIAACVLPLLSPPNTASKPG
jgi:polysaccharide biosynthesis protein PslH